MLKFSNMVPFIDLFPYFSFRVIIDNESYPNATVVKVLLIHSTH